MPARLKKGQPCRQKNTVDGDELVVAIAGLSLSTSTADDDVGGQRVASTVISIWLGANERAVVA